MDLGEIRRYLCRTEWGEFPDVLICAPESVVHGHPLYPDAKIGDARAADELIEDVLPKETAGNIRELIAGRHPGLLAVHALETLGMNAIPKTLARRLALELGLDLELGIRQINRVTHTGAGGYHRLAYPPVFEGRLRRGEYLLVDDFIGQGGTLANLRGHVESQGATVMGAVCLTGKQRSSKLQLTTNTLTELRVRHGDKLETWWTATFGYGLDRLTESEAAYLFRSDSFDIITTRIAGARRAGN